MEKETIDKLCDNKFDKYLDKYTWENYDKSAGYDYYSNLEPVEKLRFVEEFSKYLMNEFDLDEEKEVFELSYSRLENKIDKARRKEIISGAIIKIITDSGVDIADKNMKEKLENTLGKYGFK